MKTTASLSQIAPLQLIAVQNCCYLVNEANGFYSSLCAHSPPLIWLTKLELYFSGFVGNIGKNTWYR